MKKFTVTLEGHPDEIARMFSAFIREYNEIEREAYARDERLAIEFGLPGYRITPGRSSLRGTLTVPVGGA